MVIPKYKPAIGGGEEHVSQIAKRLVRRGHDVIVFTSDLLKTSPKYEYFYPRDFHDDIVQVRRFHALRFLRNYPMVPSLIPCLLRERADIIHAHIYASFVSDFAAISSAIRRVPFVLTPHGFFASAESERSYHPLTNVYVYLSQICALNIAKRIICVSNAEARNYTRLANSSKVTVIPNGVDIEYWRKLPKRGHFRNNYAVNGSIVMGIGRLSYRKGFQNLIRALPIVLKKIPNTFIVLAGEDFGFLTQLKKIVRDLDLDKHVIFTGRLSNQEVKELYVDADIVVLPSLYGEGFPIVSFEAMACGKPIIASNAGWAYDVIQPSINGLIVEPENYAELANAIVSLLEDDTLRQRMEKINKTVSLKYSWDNVVNQLEKLYCEIIENA